MNDQKLCKIFEKFTAVMGFFMWAMFCDDAMKGNVFHASIDLILALIAVYSWVYYQWNWVVNIDERGNPSASYL